MIPICNQKSQFRRCYFCSQVGKMVPVGSGGTREIPDIMLSRYACYLIAQNGDPRKESVAFAQSYFAVQTRKQELLEKSFIINVKKENLLGEEITEEHIKNNQDVRNLLAKSNILPENLPPEEDIKKLERRIKNENNKLFSNSEILPTKY